MQLICVNVVLVWSLFILYCLLPLLVLLVVIEYFIIILLEVSDKARVLCIDKNVLLLC